MSGMRIPYRDKKGKPFLVPELHEALPHILQEMEPGSWRSRIRALQATTL